MKGERNDLRYSNSEANLFQGHWGYLYGGQRAEGLAQRLYGPNRSQFLHCLTSEEQKVSETVPVRATIGDGDSQEHVP